ncbi:MAG TPA: hypothetical protein VM735_07990, partial [Candidatus Kapabacteria bacterium]|nr:hypothetical protein [Candidatus Kapabacteria bacterium]
MSLPPRDFLVHGAYAPCVSPRVFRAGPLSLEYENGDIRAVKLGDREIIRRIYGAVRDRNWHTVPGEVSRFDENVLSPGFYVSFDCRHQFREIDFLWRAEIAGDGYGNLRFSFNGEAHSTFLRNRIGLCVLHPILECAGAKCRALYQDGSVADLIFPKDVAAEQPVNGFQNLVGLAHEVAPGLWAELRFSGDLFETEDQRNWIDASFKTFSTPLSLPRPVEIKVGTRIQQSLELRLQSDTDSCFSSNKSSFGVNFPAGSAADNSEVALDLKSISQKVPFPKIGLEAADAPFLSDIEQRRLAGLKLDHLRADVNLCEENWQARMGRAAQLANALAVPMELSVHLPEGGAPGQLGELREAIAQIRGGVSRISGVLVGSSSTTTTALQFLKEAFHGAGIPVGGGSSADLYQLQLQPPPPESDFIFWSMNPQVHASDDRSIMETPKGAAHQLASMTRRFPSKPLIVSPITLKPRFNPVGIGPEPPPVRGELPSTVDPRQMSLFCAAWTVAMLAALVPSGIESMTFFKTV